MAKALSKKEMSKIEKLECYSYDGKVYVSTLFLAAYFNMSKRNITNWVKRGLEPIKNTALSRSNLFILQEAEIWVEININDVKSRNRKGNSDNKEDDDDENIDYEKLNFVEKKEYLKKKAKGTLDKLNTVEQITEREAKNKQLDMRYILKDKPKKTIEALVRSFISLMKNMMITVSKDGEQKSQDELYHIMDEYLHSEVKKFTNMLKDEGSEIDLHEIYQIMIDLYDDGISINEMVKKLNEIES